jgi:hypothetical protein
MTRHTFESHFKRCSRFPSMVIAFARRCEVARSALPAAEKTAMHLLIHALATIKMAEVWIPKLDGRWLMVPRYIQPEKDVRP